MRKLILTILLLIFSTPVWAADICVSAVDGSDSDDGTTWALAKQTVAGGLAIAVNGDRLYVDNLGNYNTSVANIVWDAGSGVYVSIISVTRNGTGCTGNAWSAGATETQGTNAFSTNIQTTAAAGTQGMYIYGMKFVSNSGSSGSNDINIATAGTTISSLTCDTCTFTNVGTNTGAQIVLGSVGTASQIKPVVRLLNCTFNLDNVAGSVPFLFRAAKITISNATIGYGGATKPTTLFGFINGGGPEAEIIDSDLSGYNTSASNIFNVAQFGGGYLIFRNVKFSSTPTLTPPGGTWGGSDGSITFINVDSGDTHNVFSYYNRLGSLTVDTSVYANGGANFDLAGASWKIATTSLASESEPFVTPWIMRWDNDTPSLIASLRIVFDSATLYTNRDIWGEFEYLSNASFPQGTLSSTRNAQPFDGTAVNLTTDTGTWTGTGGFSNPNKQVLSSTFTPAERSVVRGRLNVGVASKTIYLNPMLGVSIYPWAVQTRWTDVGAYTEGTSNHVFNNVTVNNGGSLTVK